MSLYRETGVIARSLLLLLAAVVPLVMVLSVPVINLEIVRGIFTGKYFWLFFASVALMPVTLYMAITRKYKMTRGDLLVMAFLFYLLVNSICLGTDWVNDSKFVFFWSSGLVYLFIRQALTVQTPGFFLPFRVVILVAIFLIALDACSYGILQKCSLIPSFNPDYPVTGTFFHPGPFAGFLSSVFPLSFYCWHTTRKSASRGNLMTVFCILSLLTCIAIVFVLPTTQSRAAFCGLLAGVLFLFPHRIKGLIKHWKRRKRRLALFFSIVVFSLGCMFVYSIRKESVEGRLLVWKISLRPIERRLFFGYGVDAFSAVYPAFQVSYFKSGHPSGNEKFLAAEVSSAFNEPVQITLEWGLVGLMIFVSVVWSVIASREREKETKDSQQHSLQEVLETGMKGSAISFVFFSLFSYPFDLPDLTVYFFIFLAFIPGKPLKKMALVAAGSRFLFISLSLIFTFYKFPAVATQLTLYREWGKIFLQPDFGVRSHSFSRIFGELRKNEAFLSDYSEALTKAGNYTQSISLLTLKNRMEYDDLMRLAEDFKMTGDTSRAAASYTIAHFLLPNRFYPLYYQMVMDRSKDLPRAREIARAILDMKIKVETYEMDMIRGEAEHIVGE